MWFNKVCAHETLQSVDTNLLLLGKCAQRWGRFLLVRANMKACVPDILCYGIAAVFFFPFFCSASV